MSRETIEDFKPKLAALKEMHSCTNRDMDLISRQITISCKLGLWSVTALLTEDKNMMRSIKEAMHYFQQYKRDGMYDNLLREMKCQK